MRERGASEWVSACVCVGVSVRVWVKRPVVGAVGMSCQQHWCSPLWHPPPALSPSFLFHTTQHPTPSHLGKNMYTPHSIMQSLQSALLHQSPSATNCYNCFSKFQPWLFMIRPICKLKLSKYGIQYRERTNGGELGGSFKNYGCS
jgi:hypothetical protein